MLNQHTWVYEIIQSDQSMGMVILPSMFMFAFCRKDPGLLKSKILTGRAIITDSLLQSSAVLFILCH